MGLNPKAGEFIPRQLRAEPRHSRRLRTIKGLILGPHDPTISAKLVSNPILKSPVKDMRHSFSKHGKPFKRDNQFKRPPQIRQGLILSPQDRPISTKAISSPSPKRRAYASNFFEMHSQQLQRFTQSSLELKQERRAKRKVLLHGKYQKQSQLYNLNAHQSRREVRPGPTIRTRGHCVNLDRQDGEAQLRKANQVPVVRTQGRCVYIDTQEDDSQKVTLTGWVNPNSPYLPPERIILPNPNKPFVVQMCCTRPNPNTRSQQLKPILPPRLGGTRSSIEEGHLRRFHVSKRRTKPSQTPTSKRRNDIKGLVMGPYDPAIKTHTKLNYRGKRRRKKRR